MSKTLTSVIVISLWLLYCAIAYLNNAGCPPSSGRNATYRLAYYLTKEALVRHESLSDFQKENPKGLRADCNQGYTFSINGVPDNNQVWRLVAQPQDDRKILIKILHFLSGNGYSVSCIPGIDLGWKEVRTARAVNDGNHAR